MVDYDGKIACTAFTGGCNFRCPFCHNAPLVIGDVKAQRINEDEIFDYLSKRKGLVDAVCVTGGEPTLHADLPEFFKRARQMGYATKLDTNGTNPDMLQTLIRERLLDYVAMDIKNSKEKYALTVGTQNIDMESIERSVEMLKLSGVDHEFRTTLIAEFHSEDDMRKIAEWVQGANRYYMQKYKDNDGCISHGYTPIEKEEAEKFIKIFENKVGFTGLRGYFGA